MFGGPPRNRTTGVPARSASDDVPRVQLAFRWVAGRCQRTRRAAAPRNGFRWARSRKEVEERAVLPVVLLQIASHSIASFGVPRSGSKREHGRRSRSPFARCVVV